MATTSELTFYRYSPENMEEGVLRKLFVGREAQLESIFSEIETSARKNTPRFYLIVGPRGIGKSHFLSLLYYDIKSKLNSQLIPVKLAEEEYSIFRASDLFLRILEETEEDVSDILSLDKEDDILYAALEKLKQISKQEKKRYIIFAENLHELFRQLDTDEVQKLRSIFQKHDIFSVVATAPMIFPGVSDHDEPFFNFFRIQHLNELSFNEIKTLIRKIAETEGNKNFLDEFEKYEEKIHGMEHLTGGSPRLVILFYEMITRGELENVEKAFLKIVDEHTPYYQEIFQLLSGQRRKIFDIVISAGKPVTPKEISKDARISIQTVTTQLRRLEGDGYVRSRPEGRHTKYEVRERLFRLWREMRQPLGKKRITVLLEFLQYWYTPDERNELFTAKFKILESGEKVRIKDICYYAEALTTEFKTDALLKLTPKLIQMGELEDAAHEIQSLKDTAAKTEDEELKIKIMLHESRLFISEDKYDEALKISNNVLEKSPNNELALYNKGFSLFWLKRYEETLNIFDKILLINPDDVKTLSNKGCVLLAINKYEDALEVFNKAIKINPDDETVLLNKGNTLSLLERYDESLEVFDNVLEKSPKNEPALYEKGRQLYFIDRYEEALEFFNKVLEINPNAESILTYKGKTLSNLEKYDAALKIFNEILEINPNNVEILPNKAVILINLEKYEEALKVINKALEIDSLDKFALILKSTTLVNLSRNEEALNFINKTIENISNDECLILAYIYSIKGAALNNMGDKEEAFVNLNKALELNPNDESALRLKSSILLEIKKYSESIDVARKAIKVQTNETSKIETRLILSKSYLFIDKNDDAISELDKIKDKISNQPTNLIENFIEICLNLIIYELKSENIGNAAKFLKMAYDLDSKLELNQITEYTMALLKAAAESGLPVVKSAVGELLKLKGDVYGDKIKPITKAIEIVETKDMKKYYDLQVEEREIVADIVRTITKSDELIPEEIKRKERS